ncbi:MAG: BspA family leucine-rich repeat surface protein, partial [Prevotella sp.]|nr:BspA family leucine-rich repeat surface protein [Prevotella sp.]
MKQKLFILWLMLLTGAAGVRAAEAYTYFDPSDGSLNFCYDNNRSSIKKEGYTTYNLNTGSNLPAWKEINSKVKELYFFSSFANYRPTSCYGWGYYMENLTKVTNIGYLNTSSVTNMGLMFCHCKNLTSLNVSGFNTSNVTSMTSMFEGCAKLTSLSVGSWSTSKVTDFSGMFYGCSGLTSLSVSNWNTSSATTFRYMFADCKALTSLDVSKFTTSKVTSMYCMFYNCNKLATINVSGFNTANVTTMFGMFYSCWAVTSLDVSGFNTSKVTTMAKMFTNCSSITSLDVTNFNTTKVTDMNNMFFGCSKLLALDLNSFNTSEVTDMSYMFYNCSSMVYLINTYNFWFSSSTTTKSMFGGNGKLKALCVSASMCSYLASDALSGIGTSSSPCTLYYSKSVHPSFSSITPDYQILKGGYFKSENIRPYAVYNNNALTFYYDDNETQRSGSVFDINTGTNRPAWYSYNPYVKSITVNSNFANARPTSCYEWFSGCSNLTSVSGFTYFNTSKVTTMAYMFKGCSSLSSLDLYWSNYITSNVTSMGYMFYGCSNLTSLLISGFNTSNVTDFGFMFYGCSKLSSINVSNFNTAKATYMVSMFQGCSNLTSISVSNFNTANAKSWMDQMFYGCSKLTSLDISSFTLSSSSAMMKNCTSLTYLKVPSTGSNLNTNACEGVGTTSKPCTLDPTGFTPSKEATGDGWFKWKTGYFLDNKAYANLSSDKTTLTFFYDKSWQTRTGNNYSLNTGSNAPAWHSYASGVTSVVFNTTFASARPTSCYEWFDGMTNLISITNMSSYLNTSQVTNMAYMFYNCK